MAYPDFHFYILIVRWIEPRYISFTVSVPCLRCIRDCFFVGQFVTACSHKGHWWLCASQVPLCYMQKEMNKIINKKCERCPTGKCYYKNNVCRLILDCHSLQVYIWFLQLLYSHLLIKGKTFLNEYLRRRHKQEQISRHEAALITNLHREQMSKIDQVLQGRWSHCDISLVNVSSDYKMGAILINKTILILVFLHWT